MPQPYDKSKNKSEIFLDLKADMRKHLQNIMTTKPDIIEKAIKDRNIIIKSLKADINHRKIAFMEIESRYDAQYLLVKDLTDQLKKMKTDNELLTDNNRKIIEQLDESKITICVDKKEKERSLSFKLEKFSDKMPGWAGKIFFKILSSPDVLKYILMAIFCILFIASIVGWGAIAAVLKPLLTLISL